MDNLSDSVRLVNEEDDEDDEIESPRYSFISPVASPTTAPQTPINPFVSLDQIEELKNEVQSLRSLHEKQIKVQQQFNNSILLGKHLHA